MSWPWTPIDPSPPPPKKLPGWWAVTSVVLTGIPSGEAFGAMKVGFIQQADLPGIPSGEAFGAMSVVYPQSVSLPGIPSAEAFGGSVTSPGAVTVGLFGIASGEAFGTATVSPGATSVGLAGIPSGEAFGTTTVAPGPVQVGLNGIPSAEAVGDIRVAYQVSLTGIPSEETMGALVASVTTYLSGIASGEAFGTMTVIGPPQPVQLIGIASAEAFGGSAVSPGAITVGLQGIASGEAFGTPAVTPGAVPIALQGITSQEAFGVLQAIQNVTLQGIASAESFGSMQVSPVVALTGIPSEEAFGTLDVSSAVVVEFVGAAAVSNSTITLPAHQVGDIIIIAAYRNNSTTIPSKPGASGGIPAWVDITTNTGANSCAMRTAYFKATSTSHLSGTWSNASSMVAIVLRNQNPTTPIGGSAESGGTGTNQAIAPSITLANSGGTSMIIQIHGQLTTSQLAAPGITSGAPAGYTRRAVANNNSQTSICVNTKDTSTADGSVTQVTNTGNQNAGYRGAQIEVKV